MIRALAVFLALGLSACGGAPTEQEQNLPERASGPEQIANEAATSEAQANLGDSMPDQPGGPTSDRSGAGGDTPGN